MSDAKKVAVVTPLAVRSVPLDFHLSYIEAMQYLQNNFRRLPFEIIEMRMVAPTTFPIDANRNECIGWLKKWDTDISVWIDADQRLEKDTIFKLLQGVVQYPIYAGMYYLKKPPYYPIVFQSNDKFDIFKPIWKFPEDKLFYADMIGMGCCAIRKSVFEKLESPYFKYQPIPKELGEISEYMEFKVKEGVADVSEDVWFWKQVRQKTDYKIVIDPKIQVGHCSDYVVTHGVFKGHMDYQRELTEVQLGEYKFKKFWDELCQAEIVK